MKEKGCRNKYKVSVADYLFCILYNLRQIEKKLDKMTNEN